MPNVGRPVDVVRRVAAGNVQGREGDVKILRRRLPVAVVLRGLFPVEPRGRKRNLFPLERLTHQERFGPQDELHCAARFVLNNVKGFYIRAGALV